MKRLFPLAWAGLKSRKRSTALLLSAIILSEAFLIVMGLTCSSSLYTIDMQNKDLYGEQKAVAWNLSEEQKSHFQDSLVWDEIGKITVCGAAVSETGVFLGVGWIDETAARLGHIRLTEGRLPRTENELVLEKGVYKHIGGHPYSVGDSIVLEITAVGQETPRLLTFQVVGLIESYSAVWRNAYAREGQEGIAYPPTVSFLIAKQGAGLGETMETWLLDSQSSSYNVLRDSLPEKTDIRFNDSVYPHISYFGGTSEAFQDTMEISVLIGGMILVCMTAILLNGFLMSVDRQKRRFSLLRCIGGTRKQACSYLFCETLLLLGMGIPAGILLGIPVSAGVVKIFGALNGSRLTYHFSGWVLLLAVAVCTACACLATLLPAVRASRIPPAAGVRAVCSGNRKPPGRAEVRPFGLMLLSMHRSKGKTVLTILTFALVIVVFNVLLFFSAMSDPMNYERADIILSAGYSRHDHLIKPDERTEGIPREMADMIRKKAPVKCQSMELAPMFACSVPFSQYDHYLNGYYHYDIKELGLQLWQKYGQFNYLFEEQQRFGYSDQEFLIMPEVSVFDEHLLRELEGYVSDGAIDIEAIREGSKIVLCMPDYVATFHEDGSGYESSCFLVGADPDIAGDGVIYMNTEWKAGDMLTFTWVEIQGEDGYEKYSRTVEVGAIVKDMPTVQGAPRKVLGMIMGEGAPEKLGLPCEIRSQYIYFEDDADIEETEAEMRQFISQEFPLLRIVTEMERSLADRQQRRTTISVMGMMTVCLLSLGFLGLLNTVSSRIHSHIYMIGQLRCIGMTKGQIYKMFMYEGAVFGGMASLFGTAGCFFLLPRFWTNWLYARTPWHLLLSCVLCVTLAVLTVLFPIWRVLKKTPGEMIGNGGYDCFEG